MVFDSFFQDGEMDFKYNLERSFISGYKLYDSLEAETAFASGESSLLRMILVSSFGTFALRSTMSLVAAALMVT